MKEFYTLWNAKKWEEERRERRKVHEKYEYDWTSKKGMLSEFN